MKRYVKYGDHIQPRIIRVIAYNMARATYLINKIPLPEGLESEFRLNNCSRTKLKRRNKR